VKVCIGYLGFNTGLHSREEEVEYIVDLQSAKDVVAQRILGSIVVSKNHPE